MKKRGSGEEAHEIPTVVTSYVCSDLVEFLCRNPVKG